MFTTTEAPPKEPIPFHSELTINPTYPQYLNFYCYSEPDEGGSTPIVDGIKIYEYLENHHFDFLTKL